MAKIEPVQRAETSSDKAAAPPRIGVTLSTVTSIFGIAVPLLYVIGRVYKEAYWERIGTSASLIRYGVEDYLYFGFSAMFNAILRLLIKLPLGALAPLLAVVGLVALVSLFLVLLKNALTRGSTLRRPLRRAFKHVDTWKKKGAMDAQFVSYFVSMIQYPNTVLFYFLSLILLIAATILGAHESGKYSAGRDLRSLLVKPDVTSDITTPYVHFTGHSGATSGHLIECNSEWCVVLVGGQSMAISKTSVTGIVGTSKTTKHAKVPD